MTEVVVHEGTFNLEAWFNMVSSDQPSFFSVRKLVQLTLWPNPPRLLRAQADILILWGLCRWALGSQGSRLLHSKATLQAAGSQHIFLRLTKTNKQTNKPTTKKPQNKTKQIHNETSTSQKIMFSPNDKPLPVLGVTDEWLSLHLWRAPRDGSRCLHQSDTSWLARALKIDKAQASI